MGLKERIPLRIRRALGKPFELIKRRYSLSPVDVVKANTKEAFDFFYARDDFINKQYLEPGRLELYDIVAEYCAAVVSKSSACTPPRYTACCRYWLRGRVTC